MYRRAERGPILSTYSVCPKPKPPAFIDNISLYCPHQPSAKQAEFLELGDRLAFYGGRAGCGKSDVAIMAALQGITIPSYSALLLRRTFRELKLSGALLDRMQTWFANSPAVWCPDDMWFRFPSGSRIGVGYLDSDGDLARYQSADFQFIGFDESGEFEEKWIRNMLARLRRTVDFPKNFPLRARLFSNPGGPSHDFVCDLFGIKPEDTFPEGAPIRTAVSRTGERYVFFPAHPKDNPGLDWHDYRKSLAELTETKRLQLQEGRWIKDTTELCYPAVARAKRVACLPEGQWHYGLAFDIGATNNCAFAIGAWCDWIDASYLVRVVEPPGLNTPSDVAKYVKDLDNEYKFEWITADAGGLGKGYVEEMRLWWAIPVIDAEKNDKRGYIDLFNGALTNRSVILIDGACDPLIEQSNRLVWKDERREKEMPKMRNHSCDASLYCFRRMRHYGATEDEPTENEDPFESALICRRDAALIDASDYSFAIPPELLSGE